MAISFIRRFDRGERPGRTLIVRMVQLESVKSNIELEAARIPFALRRSSLVDNGGWFVIEV